MSSTDGRIYYFAYGANVHPGWLRRRIPTAQLVGAGSLPGYCLAFRKRGRDGAARSDACASDVPGAALPGAVYRLRERELAQLGAAGAGYRAMAVRVTAGGGPMQAMTWVAAPAEIAVGLLPWDWYVALIRAGAELLDLPVAHRRWLDSVQTAADPDADRAALARAVIAAQG
ncbi:MAG: gamma-glutamylcyclotransferase family protein [Gammaproteobacteria bacterium]